jgi:hypothetical protein
MSVSYKDGKIMICTIDLFRGLIGPERDEFLDRMACEDAVIESVAAQIIEGWTQLGSRAGSCGTHATPHTPLDRAIREVAKRSGEVAKEEIEALETALAAAEAARRKAEDAKWTFYHRLGDLGFHDVAEKILRGTESKA